MLDTAAAVAAFKECSIIIIIGLNSFTKGMAARVYLRMLNIQAL